MTDSKHNQRIRFYGTEIAKAMKSWEEQGSRVTPVGSGFVVTLFEVVCDVEIRKFSVVIDAYYHDKHGLEPITINVFDTENAEQKIIDAVNERLKVGPNAVYPKGGDTA